MIQTPEQIHIQRDGTVQLWFDACAPHPLDGIYFLRGGICWPGELTKAAFEQSLFGFAVVAGIRADGPQPGMAGIEVLAEHAFATCQNVLENNRVAAEGLAPWMAKVLGTLGCRAWYTPRSAGRAETFIREIRRGGWETTRAAVFLNVDETVEECIGLLVDAQNERRLRYPAGGELHQALRDYKASEGMVLGAALAAAARLCAGVKTHPPRKRSGHWMENLRSAQNAY